MESDQSLWQNLPQHILASVLRFLTADERLKVAYVCKSWWKCLQHPLAWQQSVATFLVPIHKNMLRPISQYGHMIQDLKIEVDQSQSENRQNTCKALNILANNSKRELSSLTIQFTGHNPLFYAGIEFITELKLLLGCIGDRSEPFSQLTKLDLSGLDVAFDRTLIDILSNYHHSLEFLNIQNKNLICKVPPDCIFLLVTNCKNLKDLRVIRVSLDDRIITTIALQEHPSLRHLSVLFRHETKYTEDLSSKAWAMLAEKIPSLQVTLLFDPSCPLHRICEVMKPEIPVTVLHLEACTHIYQEVNHATALYAKTLKELVLQTCSSEELEQSLLHLAATCEKLNSLVVYCVLPENIIQQIFQLRPEIRRTGNYILKSRQD